MILQRISGMLRDLFRSNSKPKQDETAQVAARLEQRVLTLVGNLPTLPDTATRAIALADDADVDFGELAQLIEADVAIATGLLRIANSAIYSGADPATKALQAVVRLGRFQCKNLIVSISMKSLLWKMAGEEKARCEALWRHGYVTGSLCHQINRNFRLMFDGVEFSAGLLHDLGRILLLLADVECFERAGGLEFVEAPGLLDRERSAIGIDHCALGAWFGEHSKLPEALMQAMRLHHEPEWNDSSNRLAVLVAAADHMANHLQRGEQAETYDADQNPALAFLCARWSESRRERLRGEIPAMMGEALRAAAGD